MIAGLPFEEVWALDFEFLAPPGGRQEPVCLVAHELRSGRRLRLWRDQLQAGAPPFRTDAGALFVAYFASAEWGCFLSLGWPMPERVLDLYAEFRNQTNGLPLAAGRGLLGALSYFHLGGITKAQKEDTRALIMAGGPWGPAQRREILDYCESDVEALAPLLSRMWPAIGAGGPSRAMLRGRYTCAVARMEHLGTPVDAPALQQLREGWDSIKAGLVAEVDELYSVYEGTTFKEWRFKQYLQREQIPWPTLGSSGKPKLDGDTFRDMAKTHPQLHPLKELRHSLGELRLMDLAVGPDGRNRTLLSPFGTKTGRNAPSNTKSVWGPSVWVRGLVRPPYGRAMAYVDWSAQEVAIAAALSGDERLILAVESGDPYLAFAKMAGLAPPEATKASHKSVRDACKAVVLGVNYGMAAETLASRTGVHPVRARTLLESHRRTFPVFARWAEDNVDAAMLAGAAQTVYGWRLHATAGTSARTLLNFPMQGNGAEMLRIACCLATESGIGVCAPIHDALLIEADADDIEGVVDDTRKAMAEASRAVLGGLEIGTDAEVVRWPERYSDPRGAVMWERVWGLLEGDKSGGARHASYAGGS